MACGIVADRDDHGRIRCAGGNLALGNVGHTMMYSAAFVSAWDRLLENEGGYSDYPADTGGRTMWGITEAVARAHGYTGDMRDLPQSLAMQIARDSYWVPIRGDELPA